MSRTMCRLGAAGAVGAAIAATLPAAGASAAVPPGYLVQYQAYVQGSGWQSPVADGTQAGTTGLSLGTEGVRASVNAASLPGGQLCYQAHVQNTGWMAPVCDGQTAGVAGSGLRLEALQFRLTGVPKDWSVCYQGHVQNIGWQAEVCNGATAGTTGQSLRLEAIRVRLVPPPRNIGPSGSTTVPSYLFGKTVVCVANQSTQPGSFAAYSATTVVPGSVDPGATNCQTLNRAWVGFGVQVKNTSTPASGVRLLVSEPYGP